MNKTIKNRWTRELAKRAEAQGFTVIVTKNLHVLFRAPDGVRTAMAGQNGDTTRHRKNILSDLRRIGFNDEDGS